MTLSNLELGRELSNQQWETIGQLKGPLGATAKKDEMINQITSILTYRLAILLTSRQYKCLPTYRIIDLMNESDLRNGSKSIMSPSVLSQLRQYVSQISMSYRDVGYHSLQHATHVTTSLNKIVSFIIDYEREYDERQQRSSTRTAEVTSDDHATFGIGMDALVQFTMVFAAMIHDVDHTGVPNRQLVKESDKLALLYNDRSVAEQHSLYMAFTELMLPDYSDLMHAIMPTHQDKTKFRGVIIDMVLCTDIASPERMQVGKSKWKEAFESRNPQFLSRQKPTSRRNTLRHGHGYPASTIDAPSFPEDAEVKETRDVEKRRHSLTSKNTVLQSHAHRLGIKRALNLSGMTIELYPSTVEGETKLKASAIMEQAIQAADVAHLMQNWSTFLKWNKKLYDEQWNAFQDGRGDDPSVGWYQNQINFYEFYIIPLAMRLIQCQVFGQYGYDFLRLAQLNRQMWILQGEEICQFMTENYQNVVEEETKTSESNDSIEERNPGVVSAQTVQ